MKASSNKDLEQLRKLYCRTSVAMAKGSELLQKCSNLEEKLFGTTRGDIDLDYLIDMLEYSSGGGHPFSLEEVQEAWSSYLS